MYGMSQASYPDSSFDDQFYYNTSTMESAFQSEERKVFLEESNANIFRIMKAHIPHLKNIFFIYAKL